MVNNGELIDKMVGVPRDGKKGIESFIQKGLTAKADQKKWYGTR